MTLRESYEHCGRAFARNGWVKGDFDKLMAGVSSTRLSEVASDAFDKERADRPFDAELPEVLI